jgi:hypothetical protein
MMIFGMQMKMKGESYYSSTYRNCYVNTKSISTFRVISEDCQTAEGGIEWWTLFQFHMNNGEILTVSVENFTEVNKWLIDNSI